ncbi:uncharacterized protein FOMMEDRAFT_21818 [Fomitiporia mediterranea MF3/22]|uniref:uncharacterized protein n=1 Tax=Fomitiporia mediterranea (strain MF3/22) TaxID=694068 RepID=UPI0004407F52|nr:uncharacterized protein FOMMEDRAFT_21818 [Fomitiporia mediterranea MF3/22]EJD01449.1 hypothetical protein FOMMEDRAFT_21818 [Fomitiporia mediterranea MF3/22]
MGMHVLSYLKQTLKRKDKARDSDWDFGARQSDAPIRRDSFAVARRRRSTSLDRQRCPPPIQRAEEPQHQHKRISAAVGDASAGTSVARGSRGIVPAADSEAHGPRSGSPEDDVLLAAGESAKESRSAGKPSDYRRRAHSVAVMRATDPFERPTLRHASSAFTQRDLSACPSAASPSRHLAASPAPSVQSFHSLQAGPSDTNRRAALAAKRSMPQLHNVWETFLEEAAEDADSFDFPMPPHSLHTAKSPTKYATVQGSPHASGSHYPRHHHAPTASSSSTTLQPPRGLPRTPHPNVPQSYPPSSSKARPRGHVRTSHQASSSTSSCTTSNAGSTSSMAAFSSASSMTTAFEGSDDNQHARDDPAVPPTPHTSAAKSPRTFKFVDPSLLPQARKVPLQVQDVPRGVSPTSSTSSDSLSSNAVPYSHSLSTTPTPSSDCPTPSPSPSRCGPPPMSPSKHAGRLSPDVSRTSRQYRQSPEAELLLEHPLSPGSPKSDKSYRYSSATAGCRVERGLRSPLEVCEERKSYEEDVLSELGYYGTMASRAKSPQQFAVHTVPGSPPQSPSSPAMPVVPPLRRSSRQNLRAVASRSVPSAHILSLPRAKSASNIKRESQPVLERPLLSPMRSSSLLRLKKAATDAVSSGSSSVAPANLRTTQSRPFTHARSQTLQHDQLQSIRDPNMTVGNSKSTEALVSASSRSGLMGRKRSGSASAVYTQTPKTTQAPVRPPPAPPLDLTPSRLLPPKVAKDSTSGSPLTPASAVQWGYAL